MKKIALSLIAAVTLSACLDGGSSAVTRGDTLSAACPGSPHMQTLNSLPMRCGPQAISPYGY